MWICGIENSFSEIWGLLSGMQSGLPQEIACITEVFWLLLNVCYVGIAFSEPCDHMYTTLSYTALLMHHTSHCHVSHCHTSHYNALHFCVSHITLSRQTITLHCHASRHTSQITSLFLGMLTGLMTSGFLTLRRNKKNLPRPVNPIKALNWDKLHNVSWTIIVWCSFTDRVSSRRGRERREGSVLSFHCMLPGQEVVTILCWWC